MRLRGGRRVGVWGWRWYLSTPARPLPPLPPSYRPAFRFQRLGCRGRVNTAQIKQSCPESRHYLTHFQAIVLETFKFPSWSAADGLGLGVRGAVHRPLARSNCWNPCAGSMQLLHERGTPVTKRRWGCRVQCVGFQLLEQTNVSLFWQQKLPHRCFSVTSKTRLWSKFRCRNRIFLIDSAA